MNKGDRDVFESKDWRYRYKHFFELVKKVAPFEQKMEKTVQCLYDTSEERFSKRVGKVFLATFLLHALSFLRVSMAMLLGLNILIMLCLRESWFTRAQKAVSH